jgi:hypothetical protein
MLPLLALPLAALADRGDAQTALTRASGGFAAAERAGAAQASPAESAVAREQLMLAERACERRDWDDCERAAQRAYADARLAESRTRQSTAESATASLKAAVETLRAELARSGDSR